MYTEFYSSTADSKKRKNCIEEILAVWTPAYYPHSTLRVEETGLRRCTNQLATLPGDLAPVHLPRIPGMQLS